MDLSKEMDYCSTDGEEREASRVKRFNRRIKSAELVCNYIRQKDPWSEKFSSHIGILDLCATLLERHIEYECDDDGGDGLHPRDDRVV